MQRRQLIQTAAYGTVLGASGLGTAFANTSSQSGPKVVVVGGGYGGATAAKYLRIWTYNKINFTMY
jgi:sulfide dehydrogenase [flavocytochrome c] flavoprotein subunit